MDTLCNLGYLGLLTLSPLCHGVALVLGYLIAHTIKDGLNVVQIETGKLTNETKNCNIEKYNMKKVLFISLSILGLLSLTSCPKEPMWYVLIIKNTNNQNGLKAFVNEYNPGDSVLPIHIDDFNLHLSELYLNGGASFRTCKG